jgi:hypothetical protein
MARDKFGGPPPMAPQMNVDLSKADDVVCERCGNYTFQNVMLMKRMSALISPTGKEAIPSSNPQGYAGRSSTNARRGT